MLKLNTRDEHRSAQDIKKEIDALSMLQQEALRRATFVGMSPDEAKQVDARRRQIMALVDELARVKVGRP